MAVDDACPEHTGDVIEAYCQDPRVQVIRNKTNLGVGGAVMAGYQALISLPADVIVKLDGDGQMNPSLIPKLAAPILSGRADYVKGNRFYRMTDAAGMPAVRLFGNAALSFMTKLSSGYWQLFDPTNGFTAIHRLVMKELDFKRIAPRYFFESDMLYHLNQLRAVVAEMPMRARYEDEPTSLQPARMIVPFFRGNVRNFMRRIIYSYFLRGFSVASVELLVSIPLFIFGFIFGAWHWWLSMAGYSMASAGTVMLSALPMLLGTQFMLSWLNYDVASEPRYTIHSLLENSH